MNLCVLSVVAALQNVPQMQSYSLKNVFCKLHMSVAGMVMKIKHFWLLKHFCISGVLCGHVKFQRVS